VDIGGLHSSLSSTINLGNAAVRQALNMTIGGIYALDMFHAERHTHQSNFIVTTSLTTGCNIAQSGKLFYSFSSATSSLKNEWKLIGGPTWGIVQNNALVLTTSGVFGTVGYAFLKQQVNVGGGFIISFNFTATSAGEGFVFILQRDDLIDLNGGSGGNLGFKNTLNAIGVVFDFCTDRDTNPGNPSCSNKEVRLHYLPNGGSNNASPSTKVLNAPIYFPNTLNDGATHTVLINYFGKSPDWFEVFIDNDLILQKRGINLDRVIGGRNAFLGFSAATGFTSSTIKITGLTVTAVGIEDSKTKTVGLPLSNVTLLAPILNSTADGRKAITVSVQNYDLCDGLIEFGGFSARGKAIMTLDQAIDNATAAPVPSRLLSGTSLTLDGEILDADNGQYSFKFKTTTPGIYSLKIWYGAGCFVNGNNSSPVKTNPPTSTCFQYQSNRSALFAPPPAVTPAPLPEDPQGLPSAALTGIGVAVGVICAVGGAVLIIGIRMRNQWRRDKQFIDAGREAVAGKDVEYLGDQDLDALQNRLQQTLHAIQAERAKKLREGDKQSVIDELNRQRGELQEQVRRLKIKLDGGDPNAAPPPALGLPTRIRKSFTASRVSRGVSMRLSRGLSIAPPPPISEDLTPADSGLISGNPLFHRMSKALAGKKSTAVAAVDPDGV
jgi:hypothetical protein